MTIPLVKLKAIIKYFCENTDSRFLGKVKLMKLFYFLDFMHVKNYGVPITYDTYYNLDHGPVPTTILNLINEVADNPDGAALSDIVSVESVSEIGMKRIQSLRPFSSSDRDLFGGGEMEILDAVCKRFGTSNTAQIEEASHKEAPWSKTRFRDVIPYSLAADDLDCKVAREDIELLGLVS